MIGDYEVPLAFNAVGTLGILILAAAVVWWFLRKKP